MPSIPKIIHYVWLGNNALPLLEQECIKSWSLTNPDFQIVRWDESNLDIDDEVYVRAYRKKEWAFCSDYVRLKVLLEHGGVYLDTDMELIKSISPLLDNRCFLGKEDDENINAAIIGSIKEHPFIKSCFELTRKTMSKNYVAIPKIINSVYRENKKNVTLYTKDFFYPYNPFVSENKHLMYAHIKDNTYSIHHWSYSWKAPLYKRIVRKLKRAITMKL